MMFDPVIYGFTDPCDPTELADFVDQLLVIYGDKYLSLCFHRVKEPKAATAVKHHSQHQASDSNLLTSPKTSPKTSPVTSPTVCPHTKHNTKHKIQSTSKHTQRK